MEKMGFRWGMIEFKGSIRQDLNVCGQGVSGSNVGNGKQEIQCLKIRIFNRGIQVGLEAGDLNEEI